MTGLWQTKTDPGNSYPSHTPAVFEPGSHIPESLPYPAGNSFNCWCCWVVRAAPFTSLNIPSDWINLCLEFIRTYQYQVTQYGFLVYMEVWVPWTHGVCTWTVISAPENGVSSAQEYRDTPSVAWHPAPHGVGLYSDSSFDRPSPRTPCWRPQFPNFGMDKMRKTG